MATSGLEANRLRSGAFVICLARLQARLAAIADELMSRDSLFLGEDFLESSSASSILDTRALVLVSRFYPRLLRPADFLSLSLFRAQLIALWCRLLLLDEIIIWALFFPSPSFSGNLAYQHSPDLFNNRISHSVLSLPLFARRRLLNGSYERFPLFVRSQPCFGHEPGSLIDPFQAFADPGTAFCPQRLVSFLLLGCRSLTFSWTRPALFNPRSAAALGPASYLRLFSF